MTEHEVPWYESDAKEYEPYRKGGKEVADKIVDAVYDDRLPLGHWLHPYDFSEAVGVDRKDIKETLYGLAILSANGVVNSSPYKGVLSVEPVKPQDAEAALTVRNSVEELAL